jgi:DNA polymerase
MTGDLQERRFAVMEQVLTCTRCPLHEECESPVPFSGPSPAKVCVLGEAPGQQEDLEGAPFVGRSGQLLRDLMRKAGLDDNTVAFVNTASCFPSRTRTPQAEHVEACAVNKAAQLEVVDPQYVLVLGNVALSGEHPGQKIGRFHGRFWTRGGRIYFASYHPSAALRQRLYERTLAEELETFATCVAGRDWQELIPDKCVSCTGWIAWVDEEGLGWCEDHAPAEHHERQRALAAEVDDIRRELAS